MMALLDSGNYAIKHLPSNPPTYKETDFEYFRVLGQGGFGRVYLAQRTDKSGALVAMKIINKLRALRNHTTTEHTVMERIVLEKINHPFLVSLLCAFQTQSRLYLGLEFLNGGEMSRILRLVGSLEETAAQFYIAEVILAIEFLHNKNIIYRDLKTQNIILDSRGHVKLVDFGFCKYLEPGTRTYTFCGTPKYMSPEIYSRTGHGMATDMWSIGILLYNLLHGNVSFCNFKVYFLA